MHAMRERKTFVRKTNSESRRLSDMRNAVVAFQGRAASVSRERLEESFGSYETIQERNHEITTHFCWHQKRQHS